MRIELVKSMEWNHVLDMVYMAKDGAISKRSIKILQVGDVSFRAYDWSSNGEILNNRGCFRLVIWLILRTTPASSRLIGLLNFRCS